MLWVRVPSARDPERSLPHRPKLGLTLLLCSALCAQPVRGLLRRFLCSTVQQTAVEMEPLSATDPAGASELLLPAVRAWGDGDALMPAESLTRIIAP